MTNRANANPFEHVPGLDPAAIRDVATIPSQPILVGASVTVGEGAGAFSVYDSGQNPEFEIKPDGLSVTLTQTALNNIVCEPHDYWLAAVEPLDRPDVTYAGFRFEHARTINLNNGGRLLIPSRMRRANRSFVARSFYISETGTADVYRIASDLDEARLTITSIAAIVGMDQTTGNLLADLSLDFEQRL